MSTPLAAEAPVTEILLDDRHRAIADRIQLVQDLGSVVVLVPAAMARLRVGTALGLLLGAFEVIAILLAVLSARDELRGKHESSRYVDWTNLFVAVAMFMEWGYGVATGKKWFSPLFLTAAVIFVLSFIRPKLLARRGRKRVMRIDNDQLTLVTSRWRKFVLSWADVIAVAETDEGIAFHLKDGSTRRLKLRRYRNRAEIQSAIVAAPQLAASGRM